MPSLEAKRTPAVWSFRSQSVVKFALNGIRAIPVDEKQVSHLAYLFRAACPLPKLALELFLLSSLLFAGFSTTVSAQSVQEQEMYSIANELWCPLCAGIRLDACELQACVQMREEITLLLKEDRDKDYIISYFEEQYGTQVHGQPPFTGIYGWAWWTPLLMVSAAGVAIFSRMHRASAARRERPARSSMNEPSS